MRAYSPKILLSAPIAILQVVILLLPLTLAQKCGVRGYLKDPFYGADNTTTDYQTCRHYCSIKKGGPGASYHCNVFSYNANTRRCALYSLPLKYMQFREDKSSKTKFTEAKCIPKPSECKKSQSGNLIINGNFEKSDTSLGPWRSSGKASVAKKAGINSSNALFCSGRCSLFAYRGDICPGTLYSLTFDYKFVRARSGGFPGAGPNFDISFGDLSSNGYKYGVNSFKEGVWQSFYATALGDGGTGSLYPEFRFTSGGIWNLYLDNARLVAAPSTSKLGPNLLTNGNFESSVNSSDIHPWIFSNSYTDNATHSVSSPGLTTGSQKKFEYSGKLVPPPGYFPAAGMEISQFDLPTTLGKIYEINFDYKEAALPGNQTINRSVSFGPSRWLSPRQKNQTSEQAAAVKHFRRQVQITAKGPAVLDLSFSLVSGDGSTKRIITALDNARVQEVL